MKEKAKEQKNDETSIMKRQQEGDQRQKSSSNKKSELELCLAAGNKVFDLIDQF